MKRAYKKFSSNIFIFNKLSNLVVEVPVVDSSSKSLESNYLNILAGDNFSYFVKEREYLYEADISEGNGKINNYADSNLKCDTFVVS